MSSFSLNRVSVLTPHPLFQDINVTFGTGDRVGLVAGNGAGKSTLLRCLAGMAEPTAGIIVRSRGLRIGFVEQDVPERLLSLGFAESLRHAIPPDERAARGWQVDLLLGQLEVPGDFVDRPLRALSGGWQRLALIAQCWIKEKIRIVLDGLRGESSISELCRREGIAESLYYSWSKEFLEAGKRRLAGDTERAATSPGVKELRRETRELKEAVAGPSPGPAARSNQGKV